MTPLKFATLVRKYTKQSVTSLPDADIIDIADPVKNEIAGLISKRDIKGNYFIGAFPAYQNQSDGTRSIYLPLAEVPTLTGLLNQIFSVDVYLGQNDELGNPIYVRALPDDYRRWGVALTETNVQARYNNSYPKYMIQGQALYILSGAIPATITANIRMRCFPADLASLVDLTDNGDDLSSDIFWSTFNVNAIDNSETPQVFGMPIQFHELWARKTSINWKAQHPGAVPASQLDATYATDLATALDSIAENDLSGETLGRIPRDTGENL